MRGRHRLPLVVVFPAVASLLPAAAVGGAGNGKLAFVGDEFSHADVRVAFDNFVVKATEADCPSRSDPR